MSTINKRTKAKIKKLPFEQRYFRLNEVFEDKFIKEIAIEPCLYRYPALDGNCKNGNKGMQAKRSYVHRVFMMCFDLIVHEMIEEVKLFKAPTVPSPTYLYFGKKKDEDCERLFKKGTGLYTAYNPIDLDFKLYNLYLVVTKGLLVRSFPVQIQYKSYQRLMYKLTQGVRYYDTFVHNKCDINTITTVDFKEEILELHPGLKQEQFHEIMKYGFTRIKMIKMLGIKLKLSVRRHTINYTL